MSDAQQSRSGHAARGEPSGRGNDAEDHAASVIRRSIIAMVDRKLRGLPTASLQRIHEAQSDLSIAIDVALGTVSSVHGERLVILREGPADRRSTVHLEELDMEAPSRLDGLLAKPLQRGRRMSREEADAQHARYTEAADIAGPPVTHISAQQFAQRAGVQRQTVDRWRNAAKVIALPRTGRGYLYPIKQLDQHNRLPPGLHDIIALGGNGHETWNWLTSPHPRLASDSPLSALKQGETEPVLRLWKSYLLGDFE